MAISVAFLARYSWNAATRMPTYPHRSSPSSGSSPCCRLGLYARQSWLQLACSRGQLAGWRGTNEPRRCVGGSDVKARAAVLGSSSGATLEKTLLVSRHGSAVGRLAAGLSSAVVLSSKSWSKHSRQAPRLKQIGRVGRAKTTRRV